MHKSYVLIRELDKKLDMRLVIKVREDIEMINSTIDLDVKLPTYV